LVAEERIALRSGWRDLDWPAGEERIGARCGAMSGRRGRRGRAVLVAEMRGGAFWTAAEYCDVVECAGLPPRDALA